MDEVDARINLVVDEIYDALDGKSMAVALTALGIVTIDTLGYMADNSDVHGAITEYIDITIRNMQALKDQLATATIN